MIFTDDARVLYPEMNRVAILLMYRAQDKFKNSKELAEKQKIKTDEDFKKNMGAFAAEPKFKVSLRGNVPWFEHYEYRLSTFGEWTRVKSNELTWDATEVLNHLEVRAVNKMGRAGPATQIEINYQ